MPTKDEVNKTLQQAVERAGVSLQALSLECGRSPAYLSQFIQRGSPRVLPEHIRRHLAHRLQVAEALLAVDIPPTLLPISLRSTTMIERATDTDLTIDEINSVASAGGGSTLESHAVLGQWRVPLSAIPVRPSINPSLLKIIQVTGDSMAPTIGSGARVLVDLGDRRPSPAGVFVLWDGVGIVMKRIEAVPGPQALLRIISDNPVYAPYERAAEETQIFGRVVATWQWL
ncbi:MAG: S24 family peptidase [Alphaproteobacteria bacterium]|nr:MAG: S24 family peptidase [Alphaproteobacteria bacterium]